MNLFRRLRNQSDEVINEPRLEFWDRLHSHSLEPQDLRDLLKFSIETTITAKPLTGQIKFFKGTESSAHKSNVYIEEDTIRLHTHGFNQIAAVSPGDFELRERDVPEILANENGISIFAYPKTNGIVSDRIGRDEEMWDLVNEYARKVHGFNDLMSTDVRHVVDKSRVSEIYRDFGLKSGGILKEIPWDSEDIQIVLDLINGDIGINEFLYKLNIDWKITE